jgi:hypothetical protein
MNAQLSISALEAAVLGSPPARSIQAKLDELIGWYDQFNPEVREVRVNCRPATLRKFCRKNGVRGGPWLYRDRVIVPALKPRSAE